MNLHRRFSFIVAALVLIPVRLVAVDLPLWLPQAHAHNDYLHARPLLDALEQGFCSVEADIYLVDGRLLVAHERKQVKRDRTLQGMYLDPLRKRVKENGGRVYRGGPECTLLIDLKDDWRVMYPVLRNTLTNYADMLTSFVGGQKRANAVLVVITGNRDKTMFEGETVRFAAYDGEFADLETNPAPELVPWISGNWTTRFRWNGSGAIPEDELARLRGMVERAHAQRRRLRFWGAPDFPNFWQVMHVTGVDLINTDDLPGLKTFFSQR